MLKRANEGNANAQFELANCYYSGKMLKKEYPEAWCNLAFCYKYRHGVKKNLNIAKKWIDLAKYQGYDYVKSSLGAWDIKEKSNNK